jgi:hypothetical protein
MPFTTEQFMEVFRSYNTAINPLHFLMTMLSIVCIGMIIRKDRFAVSGSLLILGLMWLINGISYHIMFFSRINPIAKVFGGMFILEAVAVMVLAVMSVRQPQVKLSLARRIAGWSLVFYGVIIYSVIGWLLGHRYPAAPMFGVAPCPTVIYTLGLLLILPKKICLPVFIIPLLWVVVGSFAAFKLGMREDLGLLIAGLVTLFFLLERITPKKAGAD